MDSDQSYIRNLVREIREGSFNLPESNQLSRITIRDVIDNINSGNEKVDAYYKTKLIEYIVNKVWKELQPIRTHPAFFQIFEQTLYWEFAN